MIPKDPQPCVCTISHSLTPNKNIEGGRLLLARQKYEESKYTASLCYLSVILVAILVLLLTFFVLWMGYDHKETYVVPLGGDRKWFDGTYEGYRIRRDANNGFREPYVSDPFRSSLSAESTNDERISAFIDDNDPFRNN
uniref:Uncharacterized protein n=2 Tax=Lepeophtheirus salmonis TaxID=72036 RepID=A0A0K2TDH5_LEPSM